MPEPTFFIWKIKSLLHFYLKKPWTSTEISRDASCRRKPLTVIHKKLNPAHPAFNVGNFATQDHQICMWLHSAPLPVVPKHWEFLGISIWQIRWHNIARSSFVIFSIAAASKRTVWKICFTNNDSSTGIKSAAVQLCMQIYIIPTASSLSSSRHF